jgi:multidrug efflux system outer membrane protein
MPGGFKSAPDNAAASAPIVPDWWTLFNDPALSDLEVAALNANCDLKAAVSRVVQARAAAQSVRSQFYPVITLDPSVARARAPVRGNPSTLTTTTIPFDLSYEIDVWGRVRRAVEAADAQARATAADFGVVLQTLTADVAQNYFTLRSLDAQDRILTETIVLFQREVELTTRRQNVGIAAETDLAQARVQLETAQAQMFDVRRQRADTEHALAILTGRPPSDFDIPPDPLSGAPLSVPPGLPGELLRRRADVAEAEENLRAASASIGVAEASFYPTFTLTGAAGVASIGSTNLFDWAARFWSIGASASMPIFEGGKLRADLEQAKAKYDELESTYRSTVLGAIRDVEDSLNDLQSRAEAGAALDQAVTDSREYRRLTDLQFQQGLVSYLQVIDAERTLLTNSLAAAQTLNLRYTSTVLLIKALGGGWSPDQIAEALDAQKARGPQQ